MPCNTVTTMQTVLNADRLDLVAKAASEAFNLAVDPVLRDGVLRFSTRGADVTITAGKIETNLRRAGQEWVAASIAKDLHLAYGRVTTRDIADRLGWRVELDANDPNVLTLVRE